MTTRYKGYTIHEDSFGLYWSRGGYFLSLEDVRQDIDAFVYEEADHYSYLTPPDTPSIEWNGFDKPSEY